MEALPLPLPLLLLLLQMAPRPLPPLLSRHGPASVAAALAGAATDRRNPQGIGERGGGD